MADNLVEKGNKMVNSPVKNGLILGVILCIGALAMSFISPRTYVLWGRYALLPAAIFFMYKMGKDEKIRQEGSMDFGEAFKAIFIGTLVAYVILNVFEYVLFNFINPQLNVITHEVAIEVAEKAMDWISGIADADPEAMAEAKEQMSNDLTLEAVSRGPGNTLVTLLGNLISPCLLGGLIMGLITKSK